MMAEIVPFPSTRRRSEIEKLALLLLDHKSSSAEKLLADRLARRRDAHSRKGIAAMLIKSDIAAFEGAVRAAVWRHMMRNDGGAA